MPAQQSPDRVASSSGWRQVPDRTWFAAQYHAVTRRYHALQEHRDISVRITAKKKVKRLPNCPRKLGLNVLQVSDPECLGGVPVLTALVLRSGSCRVAGAQYHPEEPRYQGSASGSCRTSSAETQVAVAASSFVRVAATPAAVVHTHTSARTSAHSEITSQAAVRVVTPAKPRRAAPIPVARRQAAPAATTSAGDSLLPPAALTLLAVFGAMLVAAAIAVGPLLRSRLLSRGLSNRSGAPRRRRGIRYRE
jgi:hypothetical protein